MSSEPRRSWSLRAIVAGVVVALALVGAMGWLGSRGDGSGGGACRPGDRVHAQRCLADPAVRAAELDVTYGRGEKFIVDRGTFEGEPWLVFLIPGEPPRLVHHDGVFGRGGTAVAVPEGAGTAFAIWRGMGDDEVTAVVGFAGSSVEVVRVEVGGGSFEVLAREVAGERVFVLGPRRGPARASVDVRAAG